MTMINEAQSWAEMEMTRRGHGERARIAYGLPGMRP